MQFRISQSTNSIDAAGNSGWNITPLSGAFEGQIIATADGVNLQGAKFAGRTILGNIKALWGLTVLIEDLYSDPETLRGIHLGGVFDTKLDEKLTLDFDGYLDVANRACSGAKKVLAIGKQIYCKGAA